MQTLEFESTNNSLFKVLCIGAHCDDIEIGCGGTILQLLHNLKNVEIFWVVLSSDRLRAKEARHSSSKFLQSAQRATVDVKEFRNGYFPYNGGEIKDYFEVLKNKFQPDLIFSHYRNDLHQDHRVVSDLTWNTFRNHMILEYEIPKYDGDMGSPNLFVPLDRLVCMSKIRIIMQSFESQKEKLWFNEDTFISALRIRGIECNSFHGFAEAYYSRKAVLKL